jgi:hypothetical protein
MRRLIPMILVGGITLVLASFPASSPAQLSVSRPADKTDGAAPGVPPMPPLPEGETTILGGAIRNIDPVLDQFTLNVFGERPIKIQFDERTKLFHDGVAVPIRELGPADHASVQTALDGDQIFAESIHVLSQAPQGDTQGVVESYNRVSGKLTIRSALSPKPLIFFVPGDTPIARVGQPAFTSARSGLTDLTRGSLVAITFSPNLDGRAMVRRVTVLAVPGSTFVFGGNISFLDLSSGTLVLVDSRDGRSYTINFSAYRFPAAANLHVGDNVTIDASFEGERYVATSIAINSTN